LDGSIFSESNIGAKLEKVEVPGKITNPWNGIEIRF